MDCADESRDLILPLPRNSCCFGKKKKKKDNVETILPTYKPS